MKLKLNRRNSSRRSHRERIWLIRARVWKRRGTRNRYWFRYQQRVLRLGRLRWICRVLRLNRERVRRIRRGHPRFNTPAAVSVQPAGKVPEVTTKSRSPVPPVLVICC